MNFIDEENGLFPRTFQTVGGKGDDPPDVRHTALHTTDLLEAGLGRMSNDLGQTGFADSRRTIQNDRADAVGLDGSAQKLALAKNVTLAHIVIQRPGTHSRGQRGIENRFLIGSEQIFHAPTINPFASQAIAKASIFSAMKTILVPLDFSDSSVLVLNKAAEIARQLSAKVVLLHVVEPVATYVPVGATIDVVAATPPPMDETENLEAIEKRLSTLAAPLKTGGLEIEVTSLVGLAVDDILEQAGKHKADYILLGSHGHGALYHLFSGSVVTGVLKKAVCPVIVVPAKSKA